MTKFYLLVFFPLICNALNLDLPHEEGELIVELDSNLSSLSFLNSNDFSLLGGVEESNLIFIKVNNRQDLLETATKISNQPGVKSVELNLIYTLTAVPQDTYFNRQYALNRSSEGSTDAHLAWSLSTGSQRVLTAILDTGVDYTHPDLYQNYAVNSGEYGTDSNGRPKHKNGIDDDRNGYVDDYLGWDFYNNDNNPMDYHGHGTHCAGIIGARGNNNRGITGVNWKTSIIGLKIFSDNGRETNSRVILQALDYAKKIGVDITNNSWGEAGAFSQHIYNAFVRLEQSGALSVFAAGNNSTNNDLVPFYPANFNTNNSISVVSINESGRLSSFSNYGLSMDIAAPGGSIYSTLPGGKYGYKSGTSMAAPHVAGAAALIKARNPSWSASKIKSQILLKAKRSSVLNGAVNSQRKLNIYNSIR